MIKTLENSKKIKGLTKSLGYKFKRPELLLQAIRHASYVNEHPDSNMQNNERFEFLGDAVLDLAIGHILMEMFQDAEEGLLSKYRAMVVDESGLYHVALELGLANYLLLGKGEEQSHGRKKPSILADAMEAVLGAIYLDGGFEKVMEVIHRLFSPLLERLGTQEILHDYKSLLQEHTQQSHKTLPKYKMIEESGPAHDRRFKVAVYLEGEILAEGSGKSKKEAEQRAAEEAFFCLKRNSNL